MCCRVEAEARLLRGEMKAESTELRRELVAMRSEMQAEFRGLHRLLIRTSGVVLATLVGLTVTQL
jgi:hypothetical protein